MAADMALGQQSSLRRGRRRDQDGVTALVNEACSARERWGDSADLIVLKTNVVLGCCGVSGMEQVVIDCADPLRLGRWWAEALGGACWIEDVDVVETGPEERLSGLIFVPVPESKTVKNRLHSDFRPDDQNAEFY